MNRLAVMMRVDDTARADISLTAQETYYRFATDDSIEDGRLAPAESFEALAEEVVEASRALEGEHPLAPEVKMQIFADSRILQDAYSEESLRRVINKLSGLSPEFSFLHGFK